MKRIKQLFTAVFLLFLVPTATAFAQGKIIPSPSGKSEGDYTLNDVMVMVVNISDIVLGLVGALTLLMFVVGGITYLTSAGSADKVKSATKTIIASVVGLVIVFGSYLIIKFVLGALGYNFDGTIKILK